MSHEFPIPPDALARQKMLQELVKTHRSKLSESPESGTPQDLSKNRHDEPHDNGSSKRPHGA